MNHLSEILIFDPYSGASGDMIIGSLLNLGADEEIVKDAMESTANVAVTISKIIKHKIAATRVDVIQQSSTQHRYDEMAAQIRNSGMPREIKTDALGILELMGVSESKVHGVSLQDLHLHEMGQQDAIADIVGSAAAFHSLGVQKKRVMCMPISVGGGYVETVHGKLPVPAPATLEILGSSDLIWRGGPVERELLTPTGAAVLAYMVRKYGSACSVYPQLSNISAGYGAGSMEPGMPNLLRCVRGEPDISLAVDYVEMLETNVDDVTGEVLGYLIQELMADGALDVSVIPATMKKGRSGHLIRVVCRAQDVSRLARRIMVETGSLGVRQIAVRHRLTAGRSMMEVVINVAGGDYTVNVKVARDARGKILNISAEYEDCMSIARAKGLAIKEIMHLAKEAARVRLEFE